MDLSIIIGTYNRCDRLGLTLQSVVDMNVPENVTWEALVVDNNSSDRTQAVVNEIALNAEADVKYLMEKKQGLSHARNKGIEESTGALVAFIDDDCITDKNWLINVIKEFRADSSLSGIGGRVELYDMRDKPVTILTSRERRLFSSAGQLFSFIHGCNMVFERKVFRTTGGFDTTLGPGTRVLAAEDSDFVYRVHKCGHKMLYSPDVLVFHNHGRHTDSQVDSLMKGYMVGRGAFYLKHILKGDRVMLKMAYWEICGLKRIIRNGLRANESKFNPRELLRSLFTGACCFLGTYFRKALQHNRIRTVK
jgi:GT2 family glycosyltransferase